MKAKGFITLCIVFMTLSSVAQMPLNILPYLKNKYPAARLNKVKQDQEMYTVTFVNDGKKCKAWFDKKGNWLRTEVNLKWKTMPPAVRKGLNKSSFAGWQVYETKEDDMPTDTIYMFEVNNRNTLGEQRVIPMTEDYNVYFNPKGDLIKEEKVY